MEINQISDLVKSAVGFDAQRSDNVTVISRKFAGGDTAAEGPAWYDAAWFPMVARNLTAIVIALLVLLLGVRPLAKALMKTRADATPGTAAGAIGTDGAGVIDGVGEDGSPAIAVQPPVGLDQIDASRTFDDRIGAVRGFTRDNPARAALAVRDMIKADAKS